MNLFEKEAFSLFAYQYKHNAVYRAYCDLINVHPADVHTLTNIPFLPVELFKSHRVSCSENEELIFESSGTKGVTSKHYIASIEDYIQSFTSCFSEFYGAAEDFHILALLPGYLERPNSSLVYMCQHLIDRAQKPYSGFYLNDFEALHQTLTTLNKQQKPTLLIGVSFALLDFCAAFPMQCDKTIIMETGGMKGRQKELIREELHAQLRTGFGVSKIHSEYGMTELLSQAYSKGDGIFNTPKTMRVFVRDVRDPKQLSETGTGGLNIIDLSNKSSCAFIATQDLGKCHADGSFEVLGRFDSADIRGCSLMTA